MLFFWWNIISFFFSQFVWPIMVLVVGHLFPILPKVIMTMTRGEKAELIVQPQCTFFIVLICLQYLYFCCFWQPDERFIMWAYISSFCWDARNFGLKIWLWLKWKWCNHLCSPLKWFCLLPASFCLLALWLLYHNCRW